jgi:hypothetical protein
MKTLLLLLATVISSFDDGLSNKTLVGAWQLSDGDVQITKIYSDGYFSVALYNVNDKKFISTAGGSWSISGDKVVEKFEFNTAKPDDVGKEIATPFTSNGKILTLKTPAKNESWKRIDDGMPGKLAGAWLITGRMENGEIKWRKPGARKTMKILSGTRFQWIAYNPETKEFFGTGGGTYTTQNGKYTENIEFFSRDNSRVGASLQFEFSIEDGHWRHKGLSSKGDPIDEVWTQREVLDKQVSE